jgi:hypothetical protein
MPVSELFTRKRRNFTLLAIFQRSRHRIYILKGQIRDNYLE